MEPDGRPLKEDSATNEGPIFGVAGTGLKDGVQAAVSGGIVGIGFGGGV